MLKPSDCPLNPKTFAGIAGGAAAGAPVASMLTSQTVP